jgi:hypothetical protein
MKQEISTTITKNYLAQELLQEERQLKDVEMD